MGPTGDEVFLLLFIASEFALVFVVAYYLYRLGEWMRERQLKRAAALKEKRKREWAAEIERAGIRLMNGTAECTIPLSPNGDTREAVKPIRKVGGAYAYMAECWK